ncbi:hypothetical protein CL643_01405 [bacterium]|nr:hypothetical protein [bacterium]
MFSRIPISYPLYNLYMLQIILIFALSFENKWTELVQKAEKTVVHIVSLKKNNENPWTNNHSEGSGFMFKIEGSVITNHHIVADSDQIIVSSENGTVFSAELIGSDPILDIAILKIPTQFWQKPLEFRNLKNKKLLPGEEVMAIGNPFGLSSSVSKGIISAVDRFLDTKNYLKWGLIQTDVATNPGNSGGPMFDSQGHLIGMTSGKLAGEVENINFAIPIDKIIYWSEKILENKAIHPMIGLEIKEDYINQDIDSMKKIIKITNMSQSAKKLIQKNDIILAIDGNPVNSKSKAFEIVDNLDYPNTIELLIFRYGVGELRISLNLKPRALDDRYL